MSGKAPGEPGEREFAAWLTERIGRYAGREVGDDEDLSGWGLDSVALLSLCGEIEEQFGPLFDPADVWTHPTVRDLAHYLAMRHGMRRNSGRVRAAFVFTGQGAQHPRMTAGLHRELTAYRRHLARADEAVAPYVGRSVAGLIFDGDDRVHQTALTQPALFAVGYALAMTLVEEEGVRPVAVLGHGIGELAAAVVAGALSLDDAARLVCCRGAFMQYLPSGGGMMATCASPYEAADAAAGEPQVTIGAFNAARATVLSGPVEDLERVRERLAAVGIASTFLQVRHAFQSPLMQPMTSRFEAAARHVTAGRPELPYYSTVYGREYDEPLSTAYWTAQITTPVRFADAARRMLAQQGPSHVVEIGPRAVLTPFLRRIAGARGPVCLPACRGPESDAVHLAGVLSKLDAGPLSEH
ncbi:acyltransferase domain-containing protein [Streptomyces roseicoloratus]|uniref:acyltransferase domain-containing protein n=1 Tax=Streptomyces roseicoloratus TaxID=2508722 RepID=UPI001009B0B8|nr:acyltransferase domain-containing protein [Streptomyces roseicoloratus]